MRAKRFFIRVLALAGKEVLHVQRDPRTLALALVMPVVMLLLFGYGVSFDIDHLPVALVDQDRTSFSRNLARDFYASQEMVPAPAADGLADPADLLRQGRALGILTIPAGAERDLLKGERVVLELAVDGRDGPTANQLLAKADAVVRTAGAKLAGRSGAPPLIVNVSTRFNPEARSAMFLVPGLAAYLMALAAVMLTALAIATEWERGSMEQLFASPVGRLEIILGKLAPYLVIGALQMLLVVSVGTWVFEVPIRGNVAVLFSAGLLFLIAMLGQGLLISVLAKNQLVATQAGALSSLLPSLLLSGFVFPIENMPRVLQLLSSIIPARYMVHALRGVMLKGAGMAELWPDFVAMGAFALFIVTMATARFHRKLA